MCSSEPEISWTVTVSSQREEIFIWRTLEQIWRLSADDSKQRHSGSRQSFIQIYVEIGFPSVARSIFIIHKTCLALAKITRVSEQSLEVLSPGYMNWWQSVHTLAIENQSNGAQETEIREAVTIA